MWRKTTFLLLGLALITGCGGDESATGGHSLAGVWDFIEYSDHGVWATASGSVEFGADGDLMVAGEITYPGEPVESLTTSGSWSMNGDRVVLATTDGSGEWDIEFSDAEATLTLVGPVPTNVIRLCCRASSD
jgi:hypothetical protein